MKNIAFLILITAALMSCDKLVDSPVAGREIIEQEMEMVMEPEAGSKSGTDEIVKGGTDPFTEDILPFDDKTDTGGKGNN